MKRKARIYFIQPSVQV